MQLSLCPMYVLYLAVSLSGQSRLCMQGSKYEPDPCGSGNWAASWSYWIVVELAFPRYFYTLFFYMPQCWKQEFLFPLLACFSLSPSHPIKSVFFCGEHWCLQTRSCLGHRCGFFEWFLPLEMSRQAHLFLWQGNCRHGSDYTCPWMVVSTCNLWSFFRVPSSFISSILSKHTVSISAIIWFEWDRINPSRRPGLGSRSLTISCLSTKYQLEEGTH